jgi:hypothetical protein
VWRIKEEEVQRASGSEGAALQNIPYNESRWLERGWDELAYPRQRIVYAKVSSTEVYLRSSIV